MTPAALNHCQIFTPKDIISLMWRMAYKKRKVFKNILDLGAGDGRFSIGRRSASYTGYEIDQTKIPTTPERGRSFINSDVLDCIENDFDLCIGNPPYIRRALLPPEWRERASKIIEMESKGLRPRADSNGFIYFLWLSLLRTTSNALIVQLVPVEWVSRPSASPLRKFIKNAGWTVDVYRFTESIFDTVLTTAAVVIIDKSKNSGEWNYYSIDGGKTVIKTETPAEGGSEILSYGVRASEAFALRGLSPGGQSIYVLNEESRLFHGLGIDSDVTPCVTTLRHLKNTQATFTASMFKKEFVEAGLPCWLIRSDRNEISASLKKYLELKQAEANKYVTNSARGEHWFRYRVHPVPEILVASGFRKKGPKVFRNEASLVALGSVYAVFVKGRERQKQVADALRSYDFESQVVAHSNGLLKIEVRQLNTVLAQLI